MARLRRHLRPIALGLAAVMLLPGCASRLLVRECGETGTGLSSVSVLIEADRSPDPVEGLRIELFDQEGELVARLFSEREARMLPDLSPGTYTLRVYADEIGAGTLEAELVAEPGMAIAVTFDDGAARWDRFTHTSGEVLQATGAALLVATIVAARVALVVLSCGCAR